MSRMTTVTNEATLAGCPEHEGGFSVSYKTGTGIDGAILSILRTRWVAPEVAARLQERGAALSMVLPREADGRVQVLIRMPDDGRPFPSREAAQAFALERGYTRRYFTAPDLRRRRLERAAALPSPRARCSDCGDAGIKIGSGGYEPCERYRSCWSDD